MTSIMSNMNEIARLADKLTIYHEPRNSIQPAPISQRCIDNAQVETDFEDYNRIMAAIGDPEDLSRQVLADILDELHGEFDSMVIEDEL